MNPLVLDDGQHQRLGAMLATPTEIGHRLRLVFIAVFSWLAPEARLIPA